MVEGKRERVGAAANGIAGLRHNQESDGVDTHGSLVVGIIGTGGDGDQVGGIIEGDHGPDLSVGNGSTVQLVLSRASTGVGGAVGEFRRDCVGP